MPVSAEEVRHVAALARVAVTDEETVALAADLNGILVHMEALASIDTEGVMETSGLGAVGTPLRTDAGPSVAMQLPLASLAPDMRDGLLRVPRLSSHR